MMSGQKSKDQRGVSFFLALGYVCAAGLLINICVRAGLLHFRLSGLTGPGSRVGWLAGTTLCFVVAWYMGRVGRDRQRR